MRKYLPKSTDAPATESARRVISSPPMDVSLSRTADRFESIQLKEPELVFGGNRRCVDPRTGLGAYGPHEKGGATGKAQLKIGIIGTEQGIESALSALDRLSRPIEDRE